VKQLNAGASLERAVLCPLQQFINHCNQRACGLFFVYFHADKWHWYRDAQGTLARYLAEPLNANVAKNVIVFVGDGMGLSTVTAGRILKGQQLGGPGEDYRLTFETFPYVGLSKVLYPNMENYLKMISMSF
jgi:hypothetical protein